MEEKRILVTLGGRVERLQDGEKKKSWRCKFDLNDPNVWIQLALVLMVIGLGTSTIFFAMNQETSTPPPPLTNTTSLNILKSLMDEQRSPTEVEYNIVVDELTTLKSGNTPSSQPANQPTINPLGVAGCDAWTKTPLSQWDKSIRRDLIQYCVFSVKPETLEAYNTYLLKTLTTTSTTNEQSQKSALSSTLYTSTLTELKKDGFTVTNGQGQDTSYTNGNIFTTSITDYTMKYNRKTITPTTSSLRSSVNCNLVFAYSQSMAMILCFPA